LNCLKCPKHTTQHTSRKAFANNASSAGAISSVFSRISSLGNEILPPTSLVPQLTGIPASVTSALFNTALQPSLSSEIVASPPAWFTSLGPDAKAYILGIPAKESTIISQIISIEVAAGFTSLILPLAPASGAAATTDSASSNLSSSTSASGTQNFLDALSTTTNAPKSASATTTLSVSLSEISTFPVANGTTSVAANYTQAAFSSFGSSSATRVMGSIAACVIGAVGFLGVVMAL